MESTLIDQESTSLLDDTENVYDLRKLSLTQLPVLAQQLRNLTIEVVSKTGGHLGASLGVIELTVALHYVFNTPEDILIFDVGHQAYPHKILTGRKNEIETLRKKDGLSGFTKRSESVFDPFGAGHSSTSISAGLGFAVARDIQRQHHHVITVIGDGAMSAGMAYEAINNLCDLDTKMIVILNDNDMSIAPAVGALNKYLARLVTNPNYLGMRKFASKIVNRLPRTLERAAKGAEKYAKSIATGGSSNIFEEMGFYYIGPCDGHDVVGLVDLLQNVKEDENLDGPILIHLVTEKGKGFKANFSCDEKYHAVDKFDLQTGVLKKNSGLSSKSKYTNIFADKLVELGKKDDKIVAITAAMPSGTGINKFIEHFPDRGFDVGIAEQHAVTFAAGLAASGLKPFVAIYSTFLQRAYDQIIHDVAIQNLPVKFAVDRAGYVGADGATHSGSFDITFLATLPNFVIIAPSDQTELQRAVVTAALYDQGPIAFRFPRGEASQIFVTEDASAPLEIGKGRVVAFGKEVAILSLGTRLEAALEARQKLLEDGYEITVADARFAKPIDANLIEELAKNHKLVITLEEGAIGGFAAHVNNILLEAGLLGSGKELRVKNFFYPDVFIEQDSQGGQHSFAKLDSGSIYQFIRKYFQA